jgi:hypothetical protein
MENREATVEQIAFFREHGWLVVEDAVEPGPFRQIELCDPHAEMISREREAAWRCSTACEMVSARLR